ncbi:aldehyde dehydrogenase [Clostridium polyendosporum]|uniref:Aldehyde dehydrogenase n=1 Tax=Clostridium polyendosporum TaxID=69208 RepID=A0A919RY69_9CLOT|nr:aldehyde dehydrogenase [Clostridium polyendosporum]GIM28536.1 aldehyde dehydrogenase [Clostridium polyendosporum]
MYNIEKILKRQKNYYFSGKTRELDSRIESLKLLKESIKKYEKEILEALNMDLRKSQFEAYATEVGMIYEEINLMIKNLKKWAKPERKKTPLVYFPAKSIILKEPYGVVLIIGPFNYPFQLCIAPLIGAIAGGNCAMVKPSEFTPHTSEIMIKVINEVFPEEYIAVVEPYGGKEAVQDLLNKEFDYIFFTGSVRVGKIVMEAAAKNLTPVTLELGGKSPCIVDKDANISLAARRIVWGKLLNAGQTCVAPDYIYVHLDAKDKLLKSMVKEIKEQYGENMKESVDYPRIINEKNFDRLISYIDYSKLYFGGHTDKEQLYIQPTILQEVNWNHPVMIDEIFGPIFPVLEFQDLDDVIKKLNHESKPLALYYFSENKKSIEKVLNETTSGGVSINDTIVHVASPHMHFGGVGSSGIGAYHGKASFETFIHKKSIIKRGTWLDVSFRYAPFTKKVELLKKIIR